MDPIIAQFIPQFGITAPLVGILIYLLRQAESREQRASEERRQISEQFLSTVNTVVADNRIAAERMTTSLTELIATVRESRAQDREEHKLIVDAVGRVAPVVRQERASDQERTQARAGLL